MALDHCHETGMGMRMMVVVKMMTLVVMVVMIVR